MPNTIDGVINYARNTPRRDGGSWDGWCASFVYRAGGFSRAFPSAMDAGNYVSGSLRGDWENAPRGAIHYWAGVGGYGHCAFELGGGLLLMASGSVTDVWGTAMGTVSFATYARKGLPYRGWTMRWGDETLAGASTAGSGYTQIGFLMTLNDAQQQALYDMVTNVYHGLYTGGTSTPEPGVPIVTTIRSISDAVRGPVYRSTAATETELPADGSAAHVSVIQDNADTNTMVRKLLNRPATSVTLSDADKAAIAKSVADAVVAALPEGALTKADVVDAVKSIEWAAE